MRVLLTWCCCVIAQDDDTNHHMDMIAGLANMRARNYSVQEVRG